MPAACHPIRYSRTSQAQKKLIQNKSQTPPSFFHSHIFPTFLPILPLSLITFLTLQLLTTWSFCFLLSDHPNTRKWVFWGISFPCFRAEVWFPGFAFPRWLRGKWIGCNNSSSRRTDLRNLTMDSLEKCRAFSIWNLLEGAPWIELMEKVGFGIASVSFVEIFFFVEFWSLVWAEDDRAFFALDWVFIRFWCRGRYWDAFTVSWILGLSWESVGILISY